ncbi:MAG: carboxymuconolactone decarboxylase family protein [Sphaerochaetaceae bacterium]
MMKHLEHSKKIYSICESYTIIYRAFRSAAHLWKAKRSKALSAQFIERIMLAVTEVNGCAACSYVHARVALEKGLGEEEIKQLLSGTAEQVPPEQFEAILFAQHYADMRGNPSKEAWNRIVTTYAQKHAYGILAATRMMMVGNTYGIAWGAFVNRLRGLRDSRSSLGYELGMLLTCLPFMIIGGIHALFSTICRQPLLKTT